uniref:Receptor-like serine/threonine-protein kinase n=1 Tax=Ananas comosus var. bracteatus TaxID=296719 RepID=A0A6V7PMT9_ANACO|nr:unnamed protein product [Ananas comosus var. bracteatus]
MASSLSFLLLFSIFHSLERSVLSSAISSDSISFNSSLSGAQTIVSKGGNFALGFFHLGNNSSPNFYLGIWYYKISQFTSVWVANREAPISDPSSSELKISKEGNLILTNQFKTHIWSTNITSATSNYATVAEILDTGNLILRDGSEPSKVYWQSIDHPSDTWLPGASLGGTSQYFIFWNRTKPFWTSGEWNGEIFAAVPEMTPHYIYNFEYVNNANESYFTYSLQDDKLISRLVLDLSGQIKELTWMENAQEWILFWSQPKQQCDVYALCGPFGRCDENSFPYCSCVKGFSEASPSDWALSDWSRGCKRNTSLQCSSNSTSLSGSEKKDKFFLMSDVSLPANPHSLAVGSIEDCLLDLQQNSSGETLYLRLASSELPNSGTKKGKTIRVVLGSVLGILACIALVLSLGWLYNRRHKITVTKSAEGNLIAFTYNDLKRMTKNFSEKLGGGSFGSVAKGTLPDSTAIAVKRFEGLLRIGEKQFRNEVSTIGTIQHVNLVRLHGFCSEGNNRLLVYEYMPKGSLDTQLFRRNSVGTVLDWKTRYQIALGAAKGLAYLHEKCRDCIIHCDIKPENILLDDLFVPKVADFGLAKLLGRDFSRVLTTVRGTIGYLAPEWISGVAITAKADVYSYGMVLLEIISGRRNVVNSEDGSASYFPLEAVRKVNEGDVVSLLDDRLKGEAEFDELDRACRAACWCIQDSEIYRPSMGQVVQILEGVVEVGFPPIPRSLQLLAEKPGSMGFFSELSSLQSNPTQPESTSSASSKG